MPSLLCVCIKRIIKYFFFTKAHGVSLIGFGVKWFFSSSLMGTHSMVWWCLWNVLNFCNWIIYFYFVLAESSTFQTSTSKKKIREMLNEAGNHKRTNLRYLFSTSERIRIITSNFIKCKLKRSKYLRLKPSDLSTPCTGKSVFLNFPHKFN